MTNETANGDRLKIMLLTSDRFPPFRPAAKAIFGEEFAKRGHRVDWLMQAADHNQPGGAHPFGNGFAYLAPTQAGETRIQRLKKHLLDLLNDFRIFSLARRHRYDVIQVKDKYISGLLCLIAARMFGSKFCYWLAYPHAESNIYAAQHGMARYPLFYKIRGKYQSFLLYKVLLPRSDHVFVQSEQMKRDIAEHGIDENKMTPVPGSLNLAGIDYQGDEDPGPEGPIVTYVGTLIRERRLDFIIRVFSKVLQEIPDSKLLIVGKGENPEDDELLHKEIESEGVPIDSVEFTGEIPMHKVWRQIERSAVCLSPYYPTFELNSTSPTKLIEYMAMSRPVVANEHPEQSLVLGVSKAGDLRSMAGTGIRVCNRDASG